MMGRTTRESRKLRLEAVQHQALDGRGHLALLHGPADQLRQGVDAALQEVLEEGADEGEGQEEDQAHDQDKGRDGGVLAGEDLVEALAAPVLLALVGLDDAALADLLDVGIAHIGDGGAPVQAPLVLHLQNDVLQHLALVPVQVQLTQDGPVALHQLAGGEAQGQALGRGVVLDQVGDGVEGAVDRAAVVVGLAEVLAQGALLILRHVDRVLDQLVDALVLGGGDGDHGDPQQLLHGVHVHAAAVAGHLVHHVQGDDHGDVHLQKLHGQVEVALDIRGVHDVDDAPGLVNEDEVPAHQLLAGIGGHGVDARQVRDPGVGPAADRPVLPVHGDAGEVAHVLVGAGELVEEGGLAAVLVAHQGEAQQGALGQGVAAALGVEAAVLAQAGVGPALLPGRGPGLGLASGNGRGDPDPGGVRQPEGQLIAVDAKLHGVPQGGQLHHRELGAGDDAHIQKMLPQGALAPHGLDPGALPGLQLI